MTITEQPKFWVNVRFSEAKADYVVLGVFTRRDDALGDSNIGRIHGDRIDPVEMTMEQVTEMLVAEKMGKIYELIKGKI